jgi:hypothetical protein
MSTEWLGRPSQATTYWTLNLATLGMTQDLEATAQGARASDGSIKMSTTPADRSPASGLQSVRALHLPPSAHPATLPIDTPTLCPHHLKYQRSLHASRSPHGRTRTARWTTSWTACTGFRCAKSHTRYSTCDSPASSPTSHRTCPSPYSTSRHTRPSPPQLLQPPIHSKRPHRPLLHPLDSHGLHQPIHLPPTLPTQHPSSALASEMMAAHSACSLVTASGNARLRRNMYASGVH